jgi:triacylglycerol lipase
MRPVERALRHRGYDVLNIDYRSRSADVATLAAEVAQSVRRWEGDVPVNFVTHSMGGILLRVMVADGYLSDAMIHRAVMLGPPNGGSELADVLSAAPVVGRGYRRFTGPAGLELGVGPEGIAARLPPVSFELGVIAGTLSLNPLFSAVLGDENDGKVRVSRTKVAGMRDFLTVRHWHPMLMRAPTVLMQTMHFLEFGRFQHPVYHDATVRHAP